MTALIYDVIMKDIHHSGNYVHAALRNLKSQGAPIDDDLELEDGWKMDWKHYEQGSSSEFTRYRITDKDE